MENNKLMEMMEKLNAYYAKYLLEPYRIEDIEKSKKEVIAMANVMMVFEEISEAGGTTVSMETYEGWKARMHDAIITLQDLAGPSIQDIKAITRKI